VNELIGELAALGVSIWWDEVNQLIGLKINRPPDTDTVAEFTDRNNIKDASQDDRDKDRLTEISFKTVQIDVTAGVGKANFQRETLTIDILAKAPNAYGDSRRRDIFCRWLNDGNDALVRILSRRLLARFNMQPQRWKILTDIDNDAGLTDVLSVTSRVKTDDTGNPATTLMQVIAREDNKAGHDVKLTTQVFQYDQIYGYITENARPVFTSSSSAQKARGAYFCDNGTLKMSDGSDPYRFI
jgi:hypothetical protein